MSYSYAQNECGDERMISTNPDNPINQREAPGPYRKLNYQFFDWRIENIPIFCNSPYWNGYDYAYSPLWTTQSDYYHITFKDFLPDDGWELIYEKRGYKSQTYLGTQKNLVPENMMWIILYNRLLPRSNAPRWNAVRTLCVLPFKVRNRAYKRHSNAERWNERTTALSIFL